jgi:hypothetical protein
MGVGYRHSVSGLERKPDMLSYAAKIVMGKWAPPKMQPGGLLWQPAEPAGVDDDQRAAIVEVEQAEATQRAAPVPEVVT